MTSAVILDTFWEFGRGIGRMFRQQAINLVSEGARCPACGKRSKDKVEESTIRRKDKKGQLTIVKVAYRCHNRECSIYGKHQKAFSLYVRN